MFSQSSQMTRAARAGRVWTPSGVEPGANPAPAAVAGFVQRSYAAQRQARVALRALRVGVQYSGKLPRHQCVIVANRCSPLDVLLVASHTPLLPMIDERYFQLPLVGAALRATGAVATSRRDPIASAAATRRCLRALRAGVHVLCFPELGPGHDESVLPFRSGPFRLAQLARAHVVPCAIHAARSPNVVHAFSVRFLRSFHGDAATESALAREARRSVQDSLPDPRRARPHRTTRSSRASTRA